MIEIGVILGVTRRMLEEISNVAANTEGYDLPTRQYVTTGGAVYDCEQVTVSANRISTGLAGNTNDPAANSVGNCGPGWSVDLEMAIVRQAKEQMLGRRGSVSAPSVADIESDTTLADADASALTAAVAAVAGPGWDQFGNIPASIQFGETQGGLFAVVLSVTLNAWTIPPA